MLYIRLRHQDLTTWLSFCLQNTHFCHFILWHSHNLFIQYNNICTTICVLGTDARSIFLLLYSLLPRKPDKLLSSYTSPGCRGNGDATHPPQNTHRYTRVHPHYTRTGRTNTLSLSVCHTPADSQSAYGVEVSDSVTLKAKETRRDSRESR